MTGDPPSRGNSPIRPTLADILGTRFGKKTGIILAAVVVVAIIVWMYFYLPGIVLRMSIPDHCVECGEYAHGTGQQPDNETITVALMEGQDAGRVENISATVTDSTGQIQTKMVGSAQHYEWWQLFLSSRNVESFKIPTLPVGEKIVFKGNFSGSDHVVAFANFIDGGRIVILDYNI